MKRLFALIIILIGLLFVVDTTQKYLPEIIKKNTLQFSPANEEKVKIVSEESITIDIAKKAGPSVVTIAVEGIAPRSRQLPFELFFDIPSDEDEIPNEPQSIGTGFMVDSSGLVVTSKHVVADPDMKYQIITSTEKKYVVRNIYRDPLNDLALLKIDLGDNPGDALTELTLGDSANLQAGQYVVAIGTALGEFRNTVTTGVISGLGRGITAGSPYEGAVERLDNVIQTDAAINPGNSGGPLINSSGQVIGINTAVSASGQNIGFAIPINVIKDMIRNFNETGKFERPYLGVSYLMVTPEVGRRNNLPEGAYVQEIISGSSAEDAGLQRGDVITRIDGVQINEKMPLSAVIGKKKVGDSLRIEVFRDQKEEQIEAVLKVAPEQ